MTPESFTDGSVSGRIVYQGERILVLDLTLREFWDDIVPQWDNLDYDLVEQVSTVYAKGDAGILARWNEYTKRHEAKYGTPWTPGWVKP